MLLTIPMPLTDSRCRRRWTASGWMALTLACRLTAGELSALSAVAAPSGAGWPVRPGAQCSVRFGFMGIIVPAICWAISSSNASAACRRRGGLSGPQVAKGSTRRQNGPGGAIESVHRPVVSLGHEEHVAFRETLLVAVRHVDGDPAPSPDPPVKVHLIQAPATAASASPQETPERDIRTRTILRAGPSGGVSPGRAHGRRDGSSPPAPRSGCLDHLARRATRRGKPSHGNSGGGCGQRRYSQVPTSEAAQGAAGRWGRAPGECSTISIIRIARSHRWRWDRGNRPRRRMAAQRPTSCSPPSPSGFGELFREPRPRYVISPR